MALLRVCLCVWTYLLHLLWLESELELCLKEIIMHIEAERMKGREVYKVG